MPGFNRSEIMEKCFIFNEFTGAVWFAAEEDINECRNFHVRINLLQFIPSKIKQRHKQRYLRMIQAFVNQNIKIQHFPLEITQLIGIYVTSLCL